MPRLLIIAYYFPPWGMGGVQRVAKFAKYLPEFGWDVTVIAPQSSPYHQHDSSLLDELPKSVHIERVDYHDIAIRGAIGRIGPMSPIRPIVRWLSSWRDFPDRHRAFARQATSRARSLMRGKTFDAVLTSSPPPSVHLAGLALKGRAAWVADFRDPWQALTDDYGPTLLHRLRNSALHKRILQSASAVITATPELSAHFNAFGCATDLYTIRNGYDEADFANITPRSSSPDCIRIVIPGTFSRFSDPRPLFRALSIWRSQNPIRAIRVIHVGAIIDCDVAKLTGDAGFTDIFEDKGYLDHASAVRELVSADLLMISYSDPRVTDVSVPGRIYELLRSQRPLLAMTPVNGALASLLANQSGCTVIAPERDEAAALAITPLLDAGNGRPARSLDSLRQFERRVQTGALAQLLNELLSKRQGRPR